MLLLWLSCRLKLTATDDWCMFCFDLSWSSWRGVSREMERCSRQWHGAAEMPHRGERATWHVTPTRGALIRTFPWRAVRVGGDTKRLYAREEVARLAFSHCCGQSAKQAAQVCLSCVKSFRDASIKQGLPSPAHIQSAAYCGRAAQQIAAPPRLSLWQFMLIFISHRTLNVYCRSRIVSRA